jgi:hypothetical protein
MQILALHKCRRVEFFDGNFTANTGAFWNRGDSGDRIIAVAPASASE